MEHSKSNKIEHTQNLDECVEYILQHRSGWSQFTTWAREKYGINNRHANTLWKDAWIIISEDFEDSIKDTVNKTLLELEQVKLAAIEENDRRVWLEVIKYQNKIKGGEIERQEVKVTGNVSVSLNWGTDSGLQKLEE
jgi:hypothetical protein